MGILGLAYAVCPFVFIATVLGFLPGFLFPDKPLNPAYEITTTLWLSRSRLASTPAWFGSLLMLVQDWLYWPALGIASWLMCKLDGLICRSSDSEGIRLDYEWLYIQSLVMIFEATYVVAVYQIAIIILWRFLAARARTKTRSATIIRILF